ncbi:MAG TPA: glycoside hydrolase family 30 beta sandwich domain-containing protein [Candidatus Acidoferrum sp.]|nr:glycoside hydrolase family 30 beta sandwich domain-containing protein [Candidatus Acidoferrum sp.]
MKLKLVLFLSCALLFSSLSSSAQQEREERQWLTTPDRANLVAPQASSPHFSSEGGQLPVLTVDDVQHFQTMDGFGFALTGGSAQLLMRMGAAQRTVLLKALFTTGGDGIGVSYLRVSIGASDMNERVYSYDDLPIGETDAEMTKFSLGPDRADVIPVLKEILAIRPGIKILGSPWSAPAWMKTNNDVKGGELKPEYYGAFAKYFVKYIEAMRAEGIAVDAITVENEPLNPKNTPSMVMFAQEQDTFIAKDLGPAFEKAGIRTKILLYDHNPDAPSYPLSILGDPAASKYVDGTAFHLYGGDASVLTQVHDAYPKKNLCMTEQSVTARRGEGPLGIAEPVRRVMIGATRNWSRNVLLWNLAADPQNGPHTNNGGCTGCSGAITLDGDSVTKNIAFYVVEHFSQFVPPGSVRVASSEMEQLASVAFLTPDGKVVLVVSNTGNFPKSFAVKYHGKFFQTALPAESVGTYVW